MVYLLSIIHILSCIFIVVFILLQDPKGGVLGVLGGGGGSKSLFGTGGASNFLVTATKWLAIIFCCTSVTLSYFSSSNKSDLMLQPTSAEAPLATNPSKAPSEKSPTKQSPSKKPSSNK